MHTLANAGAKASLPFQQESCRKGEASSSIPIICQHGRVQSLWYRRWLLAVGRALGKVFLCKGIYLMIALPLPSPPCNQPPPNVRAA